MVATRWGWAVPMTEKQLLAVITATLYAGIGAALNTAASVVVKSSTPDPSAAVIIKFGYDPQMERAKQAAGTGAMLGLALYWWQKDGKKKVVSILTT
jgi:hypothetical protein